MVAAGLALSTSDLVPLTKLEPPDTVVEGSALGNPLYQEWCEAEARRIATSPGRPRFAIARLNKLGTRVGVYVRPEEDVPVMA